MGPEKKKRGIENSKRQKMRGTENYIN